MSHATEDPELVVTPARDGALRVLRVLRVATGRDDDRRAVVP